MKRGNLTPHEKLRNKRISKKRAPGERPFSVVKRVFHGERTQVKTLGRVRVKETFKYFAYDLYQLVTIERKRLAAAR
jgi:transposase, IS5 family